MLSGSRRIILSGCGHEVPFRVVAPTSTVDPGTPTGREIRAPYTNTLARAAPA